MSSLEPVVIKEIGFRLLSACSDRFLSVELQKFMLASKEGFDAILQAFRLATYVDIQYAYVETHLTLKERNIRLYLHTGHWYFKVLFEVAVSSTKELHISGICPDNAFSIIKSINKEIEMIKIKCYNQIKKLFEAFNGMTNVVEKVDLGQLKEDMCLFSIPCRTLILSNAWWEKSEDYGNWNNKCLRQVHHLILKGRSNLDSNKKIKEFMTFISVNFPELKTLEVDLKIYNGWCCNHWDWNDLEWPKFLNTLFPSVKGSLDFLIINYAFRRNVPFNDNVPGLQSQYDSYYFCMCYFKDFPIRDNLNLRLALRNE